MKKAHLSSPFSNIEYMYLYGEGRADNCQDRFNSHNCKILETDRHQMPSKMMELFIVLSSPLPIISHSILVLEDERED